MFRVPGTAESLDGQGLFRVFRVFRPYAPVRECVFFSRVYT